MGAKHAPLIVRFWAKVSKGTGDQCWLWTAARSSAGYGIMFGSIYLGKVYAHRVSWEAHFGRIPRGMEICHRCDNPACVRPDHLFLGTHAENMRDMSAKGRASKLVLSGEAAGSSRLTVDQVLEIVRCREKGMTHRSIAAAFGVDRSTVSAILNGKNWRRVTGRHHLSAPDYVEAVS